MLISKSLTSKWRKVESSLGTIPKPRHGHRAIAIKDMMIVFGGGNDEIVDELHIYRTSVNQWLWPSMKGDIPAGRAAYGIATNGMRVFVFGGILEFGKYSNDLYELNLATWEWKKVQPFIEKKYVPPCPRLGHSFTMNGNQIYLFGGMVNEGSNPQTHVAKYLNDLYILDISGGDDKYKWIKPKTHGNPPTPRESHTAIIYKHKDTGDPKLLIYGGMDNNRLGDVWILDIPTMTWSSPDISGTPPLPRSLHTANLVKRKMYIFGGWIPSNKINYDIFSKTKEYWKCTNTLAVLDLDQMHWTSFDESEYATVPKARAGHSSVAINSRIYIWSGRDGYRKAWNNQVCCRDLWYLELEKPRVTKNLHLIKTSVRSLDIEFEAVQNADLYIVQIKKIPMSNSNSDCESQQTIISSRNKVDSKTETLSSTEVKSIPQNKNVPNQQPPITVQSVSNSMTTEATSISKMSTSKTMTTHSNSSQIVAKKTTIKEPVVHFKLENDPVTRIQVLKALEPFPASLPLNTLLEQNNGRLPAQFLKNISNSTTGQQIYRIEINVPKSSGTIDSTSSSNTTSNTVSKESNSYIITAVIVPSEKSSQSPMVMDNSQSVKKSPVVYASKSTTKISATPVPGCSSKSSGNSNIVQPTTNPIQTVPSSSSNNQARLLMKSSTQDNVSVSSTSIQSAVTTKVASVTKIPQSDGPEDVEILRLPTNSLSNSSSAWFDAGIFKTNVISITHYYVLKENHSKHDPEDDFNTDTCPSYKDYEKINLEPATGYWIRVAAVNLQGRGPWCESTTYFLTCAPGLPPSPSNIKIAQTKDKTYISWCSPASSEDEILEHSVYLAVKAEKISNQFKAGQPLLKIYCGKDNFCMVDEKNLKKAFIDKRNPSKPAIIFRITTRNSKGYGPATDVRWLHPNDNNNVEFNKDEANASVKNSSESKRLKKN